MSKILTPNVFITNSEIVAKEFFSGGTYKNMEDLPDVPNALVISGKTNKYLQSLEYSINFDSENNPSLTLEFLDTDGNFEQNMFMHLVNVGKTALQQVFKDDARKASDASFTSKGLKITDSGRIGVNESDLVDIANYANNYNRIFVAFGTDNVLSNWSDIMSFVLNKTNINVSNGLRKYTFKYFASNESIFRPKLKFNFENPNPSREFLYLDNVDRILVTIPINYEVDSIENIIYRLVKKYLSIITRTPVQNIIGIIPNLNSGESYFNSIKPFKFKSQSKSLSPEIFGIKQENEFKAYDLITNRMKPPSAGIRPSAAAPEAQKTQNSNTQVLDVYTLACEKPTGTSDLHPGFPNFYDSLNKIDKGIKSILNTVDNFVIFQENNVKLLNFWKSKGLIGDNSNTIEKCIIFGPEQMISEYLYRNYIPASDKTAVTFEDYLNILTNEFKPTLPIYEGAEYSYDPLYSKNGNVETNVAKILLDSKYGYDLVNTMSKRKSSSNFYEQLNIDELSLNNENNNFVDFFKTRGGLLELFEIPIFLNNFTNSNILNIEFTNSELYLHGLKFAIDSNFNKAYLASLANNVNKVNINGLNLKSVFDEYEKILKDINLDKDLLKNILKQQFYLGKTQNIELNIDQYNITGGGVKSIGLTTGIQYEPKNLSKPNLFTQLRNIKPKLKRRASGLTGSVNDFMESTVGATVDFAGEIGLVTDPKILGLETKQEMEERLSKELGFKFIDEATVDRVLRSFESNIGLRFDNLVFKYQGNINLDSILLAYAASKIDGAAKQRGIDPEKLKGIDGDISAEGTGLELTQQEAYFNLANTLFTLFDIKTLDSKDKAEGLVFKPKNLGLSQENIAAELWKSLNSQQIKLSIKTLPFFHLSTFRLVNFKPCFVFSKQVTPININSKTNSTSLDFFTGVYNIAAIKHVINTRECYSQFMLIKSIGNAYAL